MTDIVERLRKREMLAVIGRNRPDIYRDAVNEIERLRKDVKTAIMGDSAELRDAKKELERLRAALKPFASGFVSYDDPDIDGGFTIEWDIYPKDLEAAKAALEGK